jgi:predicted DNA-binding protein (MmcQ/YjbR family)
VSFDRMLAHCLAKPGAWRDEPWEGTVVAKVDQKIFCFVGESSVGVKCGDRLEADEWLLRHPADAEPMPYIGRSGWNTLHTGRGIPDSEIHDAIDDSYLMVVSKLPKKRRPDGWNDAEE